MTLSRVNTLTLTECCEAFRVNDIPMTEMKLAALLKTGHYDWGMAIDMRHTECLIFKDAFYKWLSGQIGGECVRLYEQE